MVGLVQERLRWNTKHKFQRNFRTANISIRQYMRESEKCQITKAKLCRIFIELFPLSIFWINTKFSADYCAPLIFHHRFQLKFKRNQAGLYPSNKQGGSQIR